MLSVDELKNQNTFFPYKDGDKPVTEWYTQHFEYQIKLYANGSLILSHHDEVEGNTWSIKKLKSLDDLKNVYEAITEKTFI